MALPPPPRATALGERADWFELCALLAPDWSFSATQAVSALDLEGVVGGRDAEPDIPDDEWHDDLAEVLPGESDLGGGGAEEGYDEVGPGHDDPCVAGEDLIRTAWRRSEACGKGAGAYPFGVERARITLDGRTGLPGAGSVYLFLLALSRYPHKPRGAPEAGAKLFEDVAATAVRSYFGLAPGDVLVFGSPRRRCAPRGFREATGELCRMLGSGARPGTRHRQGVPKDGGLDVFATRAFPDGRPGQLAVFAQCATGDDWEEKGQALQPSSWLRIYVEGDAGAEPVRCLFVPFCIEDDRRWFEVCGRSGIIFDRCRIACHAARVAEADLLARCAMWFSRVVHGRGAQ
jgi:hypothetical protein